MHLPAPRRPARAEAPSSILGSAFNRLRNQARTLLIVSGAFLALVSTAGAIGRLATSEGDFPGSVSTPDSGFIPYLAPSINSSSNSADPEGPASSEGGNGSRPRGADPGFAGRIPNRIVIPAIGLDAPVKPVNFARIEVDGASYRQWQAPDEFAVGWHRTSALLSEPGNTVLNGHHNAHGEVFRHLVQLRVGDPIVVFSAEGPRAFAVSEKMTLPERGQSLDVRLANAQWIQPTDDERLTLITCWPYSSNTHRLVLIAYPFDGDPAALMSATPRARLRAAPSPTPTATPDVGPIPTSTPGAPEVRPQDPPSPADTATPIPATLAASATHTSELASVTPTSAPPPTDPPPTEPPPPSPPPPTDPPPTESPPEPSPEPSASP